MADARNPWDPPTVEEVLVPVVAACPSFAPVWAEVAGSRWAVGDEDAYSVILELAGHLIALRRRTDTSEIAPTFVAVEEMLAGADPGLEELLTVHFIAGLQEDARSSGDWAFADGFTPFLGPLMTAAWRSAFYRWKSETNTPPSL